MITGILGKKIGMSQVFQEDGRVAPVTVVEAGPCIITQVKTTTDRTGKSMAFVTVEDFTGRTELVVFSGCYGRRREEMPAIEDEIHAARREGVDLRTQLMPVRVQQGALVCIDTEPGQPDE